MRYSFNLAHLYLARINYRHPTIPVLQEMTHLLQRMNRWLKFFCRVFDQLIWFNYYPLSQRDQNYGQPRQHIKKQRRYFVNKGLSIQGYGFSSSHVWVWELDYKESWELKNWCFWTVVLEKTLESPFNCKEIQPVHPRGDHPGCSLEGLILKLKLQYFGYLMRRADSFEKTLMLGKIEGRRRGQQRTR